jgi:hypothetical protein
MENTRYLVVIVGTVVAIGVFRYLEDRAAPQAIVQARPIPAPASEPTPFPTLNPTPLAEPDLSRVVTFSGRVITGARVMQVRSDGILFKCDQGLVKLRFADLPAGFALYYGRMAAMDTQQQGAPPRFGPNPGGSVREGITGNPIPTATQAERKYAYDIQHAALKAKIKEDTDTIDRWNRQSNINVSEQPDFRRVTQEAFEYAQADLRLATAQLTELEVNGP